MCRRNKHVRMVYKNGNNNNNNIDVIEIRLKQNYYESWKIYT